MTHSELMDRFPMSIPIPMSFMNKRVSKKPLSFMAKSVPQIPTMPRSFMNKKFGAEKPRSFTKPVYVPTMPRSFAQNKRLPPKPKSFLKPPQIPMFALKPISFMQVMQQKEIIPKPKSFMKKDPTQTTNKRLQRNYEITHPNSKKRRVNNHKTHILDLCAESSDDAMQQTQTHTDNSKTIRLLNDIKNNENDDTNIDIEDKEVLLYGISIGTHSHYWSPRNAENTDNMQPKLVFNKYKSSFDIHLKSTAQQNYVQISIEHSNISQLVIPKNPSFFPCNQMSQCLAFGQYLNVIFLTLKQPLTAYKWLEAYFRPCNSYYTVSHPSKAFISIVIDAQSFQQLFNIINSRFPCNLLDYHTIIENEDKNAFLKNLRVDKTMRNEWQIINKRKTLQCLNAELEESDCDTYCDSDSDSNDESDKCEKDEASDHDSDSDSSLSSRMSELQEFENSTTNKTILSDYKSYIENREFLSKPHHNNSLLYVMNTKKEPYHKDERCYWVFPTQYSHKEEIFIIRGTDYQRLSNNEWLNDDIVNFGMKYIYSAWPSHIKKRAYVFNSFFFSSIKKIFKKQHKSREQKVRQIIKQTKSFGNIFDREYIIIPICDGNHWELLIIWNHNIVVENAGECYILVLDSTNGNKSIHKGVFSVVKRWLNVHAQVGGHGLTLFNSKTLSTHCIKVPQQPNEFDCGCFLLKNMYQFGIEGGLNIKSCSKTKWYSVKDGVKYRREMLAVIDILIKEQEKYVTEMYKQLKMKCDEKFIQKIKTHNNINSVL